MTETISASLIDQFSNVMHLLVEQKESKMRPCVRTEIANGENHYFDRLGNFDASEVVGRAQHTELLDPAHTRRMASVKRYGAVTYLDDIDKFKMLIDPTSDYTVKLARAHARNFDQVTINALLGSAATGRSGTGSAATFDSNNAIAASSSGLTIAKFNKALRLLENGNVDLERARIYLALNGGAVEDLLSDSSNNLTSFDFQGSKYALAGAAVPDFRGVRLVRCQQIPNYNSTDSRGILFTEDTMKVAIAQDMVVKTADRGDLNHLQQISTYMMFGAVRMEEATAVDIQYTI